MRYSACRFVAGTGHPRAVFGGGTLSHMRPLRGDRLMIISNGVRLPRWRWMPYGHAMASWQRKRRNLPETARCTARTCGNIYPLDLRDDASSEHYIKTLDIRSTARILTR